MAVDRVGIGIPAFRALPGGRARLVLDLGGPLQVQRDAFEGGLSLRLLQGRLEGRGQGRDLPTMHFGTALSRVRLLPSDDAVELRLELRAPVEVTYELQIEEERSRLVIDVGAPASPLPPWPPTCTDGANAEACAHPESEADTEAEGDGPSPSGRSRRIGLDGADDGLESTSP